MLICIVFLNVAKVIFSYKRFITNKTPKSQHSISLNIIRNVISTSYFEDGSIL